MRHLRRDYRKLKNEKGKGIRVDSSNNIAAITSSNSDGVDYVLFISEVSSLNRWIMDLVDCFTLCQIEIGLLLISAWIIVKCTWIITPSAML